jgi:hypothetical protein
VGLKLLSLTTAKGNELPTLNQARIITAVLASLLISSVGMQSSVADEIAYDQNLTQTSSGTTPLKALNLIRESSSEKVSNPAVPEISNQSSVTVASISASSVIDTLKWVCKATLTLVGIGAWVTTVYYSGGMLLTVSNWVIRYVTVPSLLCNWL